MSIVLVLEVKLLSQAIDVVKKNLQGNFVLLVTIHARANKLLMKVLLDSTL